jgi:hypothetical protein
VAIIDRPVYQHPQEDGRTYIEHFPTGKPAADIAALWTWVQQQMGVAPQARPGQGSPQARPQQVAPPAAANQQRPPGVRARPAEQPAPPAAAARARGVR